MALVSAEDLRVDIAGVPACDGLTFETTAERVLLLAAPRALFEALAGLRPIVRGSLRVRDHAPVDAILARRLAAAAHEPPLPPKWSALEYVTWSARLAGHKARDARALARDAIDRVQLGPLASGRLKGLVPHARRAVVLAAALATGAEVIVLEDPLGGLPEETARTWADVVVTALEDRAWVVLAGAVPLTSPLSLVAEEALVVSGSRLEARGAPATLAAANHRFVARIHGSLDALEAALASRGATLDVQGAQVLLALGDSVTTADLFGMAAAADVTIVEMVPVARAFT